MGESVSATIDDTMTAPTSVKANSVKSAPVSPAEEADRHIHGDEHDGHRNDGVWPIHARREIAACVGFMPSSRWRFDVLHHDDGVVDHQADCEDERKQRQQVDRVTEREHQRESADQRQRDRYRRDHHRPDRAQKSEHDERDDDERLRERPDEPRRLRCSRISWSRR